jgi:phage terminase large subunit
LTAMIDVIPVHISKRVFNPVYIPHLTNTARTQIFYGGSSSGKSVFLAQRAVYDLLRGDRNYLICRAVARTLKKSTFAEIKKVISAWGMAAEFKINETDLTITCGNGCQIIFAGLDDIEKLKSITPAKGVITDVWVEEATETNRNDVRQLLKRQRGGDEATLKRLTLSFNPILQNHWIYNEYFAGVSWTDKQTEYKSPELSILKTWYIHNRFLTPDDVRDLENEPDKYFYNVYTLGNWGVLGNVIFTNWRVEDLSGMTDQFTNTRHGLDFGFANDPASYHRYHYDRMRQTIYVFGEVYETGLTNPDLADLIRPMAGDEQVRCDSAEPKSIRELREHKINAVPADKGKDSVNFGIQWLQQQTIIVDVSCINARNELMAYKWKEDASGQVASPPRPVDKNNHFIDDMRYAHEKDMVRRGSGGIHV